MNFDRDRSAEQPSILSNIAYENIDNHFVQVKHRKALFTEFEGYVRAAGNQPDSQDFAHNLRAIILAGVVDSGRPESSKLKHYSKALRVSLEYTIKRGKIDEEVGDLSSILNGAFELATSSADLLIAEKESKGLLPSKNERHLLMDAASIGDAAAYFYAGLEDNDVANHWFAKAIEVNKRIVMLSTAASRNTSDGSIRVDPLIDAYNANISLFNHTNYFLSQELKRDNLQEEDTAGYHTRLVFLSGQVSQYILTAFELRASNLNAIKERLGIENPDVDQKEASDQYKRENKFLVKKIQDSSKHINDVVRVVAQKVWEEVNSRGPSEMSIPQFSASRDNIIRAVLSYTRITVIKEGEVLPSMKESKNHEYESLTSIIDDNIQALKNMASIISKYKLATFTPLVLEDGSLEDLDRDETSVRHYIKLLEQYRQEFYPTFLPKFKHSYSLLSVVGVLRGDKPRNKAQHKAQNPKRKR